MSRIVVIEDNPANMKLATFLLNSAGHEVLQATDAESGLVLIRTVMPALVLMDIQLPSMDGLTATRQLKADPLIAHIPVIALTSYAMKGDEQTMSAAGCDSYLPKPIHHQELLALVNKMLGDT
ncbi:response regulator [Methylobacter psychrophilus]|uniref:response regulator n=1 Tax=Methylobacter psychrophilus TaxID=96941 RepID=UPI0021D4E48B|nr:response regulator [Methylobacter psychrophilus]